MNPTTLYTLSLPEKTVELSSRSGGHETATSSILNGNTSVNSTGVGEQSFDLSARFDGDRRATWNGQSLEELGNNPVITILPLGNVTHVGYDGYYVPSSTSRNPTLAEPAGDTLGMSDASESITTTLEWSGTRKSHWIGAEVSDSDDLTNPFGTTQTSLVGIPTAAARVRAVDSQSSPTDRVTPTPTQTVTAQHGDVDLIDTADLPGSTPTILYDLPYDLQGDVDPGVWDTHGHASILDDDDVVAWQRVFNTAHEFDASAECVLENGLLRVRLDEPDAGDQTASLTAERWDTGTDSWTTVSLPSYSDGELATDWQPVDVDLTRIGQASVHALVEFEAVAGDAAGDIFRLDLRLFRGWSDVLVTIPPSESGPVPPALYDRLEPIASTRVVDSGVEQTLVERQEVR